MFPTHQRSDRARDERAYGYPSPPQQQHQFASDQHHPSLQRQVSPPQDYHMNQPQQQQYSPPQGYQQSSSYGHPDMNQLPPQQQQVDHRQYVDYGMEPHHSGVYGHSYPQGDYEHSRDVPHQGPPHHTENKAQHAAFPKWVPPAGVLPTSESQNSTSRETHQDLQRDAKQDTNLNLSHHSTSMESTGSTDSAPVPGQKSYHWKPPAALQAFQSANEEENAGGEVSGVQHGDAASLDPNEDNSEFSNFLSWAKLEDPNELSEYLFNNPDICLTTDANGDTFLHGACEVGNISMVQFFLKNFYDDSVSALRVCNRQGFEPIHLAAYCGMIHIVRTLLKFDPTLSQHRTQSGSTLLHLAVANSNFPLVNFLLDILDDDTIRAVNKMGSNAFHLACKFGCYPVLERLCSLPDGTFDFENKVDNTTCSQMVCMNFDFSMQLLFSKGAKLQSKDVGKCIGPELRKIISSRKEFGSSDSYEYQPPSDSGSPYAKSRLRKSAGGVSLVEEQAAPPPPKPSVEFNRKPTSYFPPTNASFLPPKEDKSQKPKPQPSSGGKKGKKILQSNSWIKNSSDEGMVKVSSALGSDQQPAASSVASASVDSPERKPDPVSYDRAELEVPVSKMEEVTINDSVSQNERRAVESAVEQPPRATEPNPDQQLFDFVASSKTPQLEGVLGVNPNIHRDVNLIRRPEDGASLLHHAASCGLLDVAQYLVEGIGADVDAKDLSNQTPLHYAVKAGQLLLVRYLVKYCGAALDCEDSHGSTALQLLPGSAANGENAAEIERIIKKSIKKSPEKRMKVSKPKFSGASK